MSDHPREVQRTMRKLFLCDDIWLDTFHWVDREKVGLELAVLSDRFDGLVDLHLGASGKNARKWKLARLAILGNSEGGMEIFKLLPNDQHSGPWPLPEEQPLPHQVYAYSQLHIFFVNHQVITFLRTIQRLFESHIAIKVGIGHQATRCWSVFVEHIWPLLRQTINSIEFCELYGEIYTLRTHISPTFLRDCTNLRSIIGRADHVPEFPPNDTERADVGQAICQWLHIPRADGRPKVIKNNEDLTCIYLDQFFVDAMKETFLSATTCVSFIIVCCGISSGPFELENVQTHERLALRKVANALWLIVRSPIVPNTTAVAEQWAEWELDAMEEKEWKMINFSLKDDTDQFLGPLSPTA